MKLSLNYLSFSVCMRIKISIVLQPYYPPLQNYIPSFYFIFFFNKLIPSSHSFFFYPGARQTLALLVVSCPHGIFVFFLVTGCISLSSHICMHVCICLFAPAWACARAYEYVCTCTCIYVMCVCEEQGGGGGGAEGGAGVVRAFVYIRVTMDVRTY